MSNPQFCVSGKRSMTAKNTRIKVRLDLHITICDFKRRVCNFDVTLCSLSLHDDVIKWKHFPRYWPFVRGINRLPVKSPHNKGQWRGTLMFSLICAWINCWANNREAGDLRRHQAQYDVTVMPWPDAVVLLNLWKLAWQGGLTKLCTSH